MNKPYSPKPTDARCNVWQGDIDDVFYAPPFTTFSRGQFLTLAFNCLDQASTPQDSREIQKAQAIIGALIENEAENEDRPTITSPVLTTRTRAAA